MIRFFFSFARTWLGALLLHWIFAFFSSLIPGEKLIKSDLLLAFHHPSPSYPVHILIVPRAQLKTLLDLPTADGKFEIELLNAVHQLVDRFELDRKGYRLIVNGGEYQEVKHLHFHLVSGEEIINE